MTDTSLAHIASALPGYDTQALHVDTALAFLHTLAQPVTQGPPVVLAA